MSFTRRALLVLLILIPPSVAAVSTKLLHFPRRFAVVEEGKLYRGGYPSEDQLENLADEKRIHTVISLTDAKNTPEELELKHAVAKLDLKQRRFPMPGNGCGEFGVMDAAADAIADESNWPAYFHCAAGHNRSSAAHAAYLMKHRGYTLEAALKELEENYRFDPVEQSELKAHLTAYAKHLSESPPKSSGP